MTKIGLLADLHLGYSRGTREANGVNVREQDVIEAAQAAVQNLVKAKVDFIIDLGDTANTPAPRKRALLALCDIINSSELLWYSANGNHTLQRTNSDIHLYDVLAKWCPHFHGYTVPSMAEDTGVYIIPYGTEQDAIKDIPSDAVLVAGHFACDDVPFPGQHVAVADLPREIPTFLGHYHTRKVYGWPDPNFPVYVGATERFAWGEHRNPTGVAVFDMSTITLQFIEHPTREWINIETDKDGIIDELRNQELDGKIVRATIAASAEEYSTLDTKEIRRLSSAALEFTMRRQSATKPIESRDSTDTVSLGLLEEWQTHATEQKLSKKVRTLGEQALATAGSIDS